MNKLAGLAGRLTASNQSTDDQLFIDAGSSNTRIFIGERLVFSEPTCVAVHVPTDTVIAIGTKAQSLLGKTAEDIEVSFPVQYGVIARPGHFETFLQTVFKRVMTDFSLKRTLMGTKAWYAIPAEASPVEKQFIKEVMSRLGLGRAELVPVVTAAYHNLMSDGASTQGYCVLDIGGQTADIGVFSADSLVEGRTFKWGGLLFTEALQDMIRNEHQCAVGWHATEQVKKDIGRVRFPDQPTQRPDKTTVRGKDVISQVSKTVVVSADSFEEMFEEIVEEFFSSLEIFFAELPSELVTNSLDQGLYLTGATSQFKGLGDLLSHKLHSSVHYSTQPDTDVVRGMLKYAKKQ